MDSLVAAGEAAARGSAAAPGDGACGRAAGRGGRTGVCVLGEVAAILLDMRAVSSPVLDPADAGRGMLHALQALLLGLIVLVIL